jgi:hypothetical protein
VRYVERMFRMQAGRSTVAVASSIELRCKAGIATTDTRRAADAVHLHADADRQRGACLGGADLRARGPQGVERSRLHGVENQRESAGTFCLRLDYSCSWSMRTGT